MMNNISPSLAIKDLKSEVKPIWCPGCGDYGVLNAAYRAIIDLQLEPQKTVIASGIGCSGRFPAFVKTYGFHGVHGRVLPLATGIKVANPELTVFAVGGDGDAYSIGSAHLPHAARRNIDITYIVMDNEIYGLTKGQPSPTSPPGMIKKVSPYGTFDQPLNPIMMVLSYGASFVARGFSSDVKGLTEIIKRAVKHHGFSFVEVISPCVAFNNTYEYYKHHTAMLPDEHDPRDFMSAMRYAMGSEKFYLGVFYENERPAHDAGLREIGVKAGANFNFDKLMDDFAR
jgi:2-oxoglutarate/2-oxoacid ferredoxin oxidoreductase subunit beta